MYDPHHHDRGPRGVRGGLGAALARVFPVALALPLLTSCSEFLGPYVVEAYLTPTLVSTSLRFTTIAATGHHTCAVAVDGTTYCWGKNEYGELGHPGPMDTCVSPLLGEFPCSGTPLAVALAPPFVQLVGALGASRSCGRTAEGTVYCWGFGLGGQLGDGARSNRTDPAPVDGGLVFDDLRSAAGSLTCGIARDGHTYCWGVNYRGQLGNGVSSSIEPVPVRITGELRFRAIDLGEYHACGLTDDGAAYCWGSNWSGTLGVGSAGGSGGLMEATTPQPVTGDLRFRAIATGSDQTCGLTEAGRAYCWGASYGAGSVAGDGYVGTPRPVAGNHVFVSIHAGFLHTCGLTDAGEAYCWGQNYAGELGNGTTIPSATPVRVKTDVQFTSLSQRPTCGLTADGHAYCWGNNPFGQVGHRGGDVR